MSIKKFTMGYYWVKHYNHNRLQIMYFNGLRFEGFVNDSHIHDEIESYIQVEPPSQRVDTWNDLKSRKE
jgi:hypothetical protein